MWEIEVAPKKIHKIYVVEENHSNINGENFYKYYYFRYEQSAQEFLWVKKQEGRKNKGDFYDYKMCNPLLLED